MGYHYYNYEAYIETEKSYTLGEITQALSAFTILESAGSSVTLIFGDWKLWLTLSTAGHIAEEAAEIAERYNVPALKKCSTRLEIFAEDDPEELHYNDHLYVLEALSLLSGIHIFDPSLGEFPYEEPVENEEPADDRDAPDTGFLEYVEGNDTIEHYVNVLRMHPKLDGIWLNLGATYQDTGRHQLATRCYEISVALNPANFMAYYNMAENERFRFKNPEKAKAYYVKSMEADPHDGDAATSLGRMYAEEGAREKAIEYMLKGYEADPGNHYSSMSLGFYFLLYGEPEKALYYAQIAIALGETEISFLNKGHVHLIRGEAQEALICYGKSLKAFKKAAAFWKDYDSDFEVMPQYGITLEYYNSLKEAIALQVSVDTDFLELVEGNKEINALVRKLQVNPDNWERWQVLSRAYSEAERDDLAARCYQASVFLNDQNAEGHYNVGRNYLAEGEYERAKLHLLKAIALDPRQGDYQTTLGEVHAEEGDRETALACLQGAVETDPENEYSNANLGYYLLFYGEARKALPYIEKSISLGGMDVSGFNKAHVFLIEGEEQKAVEFYALSLSHYLEREDFWADFDEDFQFMAQYGITLEYYNSMKAKVEYYRFTNDISLN